MTITVNDTIAAGKSWLLNRLSDGQHCPLCGQHAKMYKRKITSGMAQSLIRMYRSAQMEWIHVSLIGGRSRDHAMLAYWGLIEEQKAMGIHGGRAGYWRVTDRGLEFLQSKINVPKYAKVYDGKVYGFEGDPVTIREALGTKFDYQELMQGI